MTDNTDKRVMPGTTVPDEPTTVYTVNVYCMTTWATGAMRGTTTRSFLIEEASTILGGCQAINKAWERCQGKALEGYSPTITPNPAELGWPMGGAE